MTGWFSKYQGFVATILSAFIIVIGGGFVAYKVSDRMTKAQFEKALIPDLLSENLSIKRTAVYLYKKYLSEDELKDFLKASGRDFLALSGINHKTKISTPFVLDTGKLSSSTSASNKTKTQEAFQNDKATLLFDRFYNVNTKELIVNKANIINKPNLSDVFQYQGKQLKIESIHQQIGLLVTPSGVEGPVLKGIKFKVLD